MLKITRLADYAVVIISSFKGVEKEIVSAQQIIKKTKLQQATVNKILAILVKKKILIAFRGTSGGYKLRRDLSNISIKDLIEAIEGPVSLTDCLNKNANDCNLFNVCITKNTWHLVNNAVKETLDKIKIQDIGKKSCNDYERFFKI